MKKRYTFLTALTLAFACHSNAQWFVASQTASSDDVLSFGVMSDTHFENNVGVGANVKVPRALKSLTSKRALDALFVVGDLSNGGTASQYEQFVQAFTADSNFVNPVRNKVFMMGNHDNYDANGQQNYADVLSVFNGDEAYPLDQYKVINGYPFITISQRNSSNTDGYNVSYGEEAYPEEVCTQLAEWLEKASTECPGKPIFVFTHVPPTNTMYSSWSGEGSSNTTPNWAMRPIGAVLASYPQVIVFSGHSHFPMGDPRSIHQGVDPTSSRNNYYTAIGTGSTTYSEIESGMVDAGIHPAGYAQVTEGLIVTVKKSGDVVIHRYDTYRDSEIHPEDPWTVKAPFDGSQFQYADTRDSLELKAGQAYRTGLPAPEWTATDSLSFDVDAYEAKVTFPQATDNDCVFRYKLVMKDNGGRVVDTQWLFSGFFLNGDMPATLTATFEGIKSTKTYSVEVSAYDSYNNVSTTTLKGSFTVPVDTDPANFPPTPVAQWDFEDESDPFANSIEGSAYSIESGTVSGSTVTIEKSGKVIEGPKDDNNAYYLPTAGVFQVTTGTAETDTISTYTLKMDIRTDKVNVWNALLQTDPENSDDADIFIRNNAKIGNGTIGYAGTMKADKWTRLVLVVDSGAPSLYLDGELINKSTTSNSRYMLKGGKFYLFCDDDGEVYANDIANVTIWDKALNARQVGNMGKIATNDYLTTSTPEVILYDNEVNFDLVISSTVEPSFDLPEWIHAVSASPTIGDNITYSFACDALEEGSDERADEIFVSAPGTDLEDLSITVMQQNRGDVLNEAKVGEWNFDNSSDLLENAVSSSGYSLSVGKSGTKTYTDCTMTESGISEIEGPTTDSKAIAIPKLTAFKLTNGSEADMNNYTCMMDLRINKASWYGLFQNDITNSRDASIFIKSSGAIGLNVVGCSYGGNISLGTWHRVVWTVKEGVLAIYVDGSLVVQGTNANTTRWTIAADGAYFFADNDGELGDIDIANITLWSDFLTKDQISNLGGVK